MLLLGFLFTLSCESSLPCTRLLCRGALAAASIAAGVLVPVWVRALFACCCWLVSSAALAVLGNDAATAAGGDGTSEKSASAVLCSLAAATSS